MSDSKNNPDPKYAKEAANLSLKEKLLSTKKRGDRITASEIAVTTGFTNWRAFGGVIRTWGRQNGFVLIPVAGDGWRIGLPVDHIDAGRKLGDSARRKDERGLKVLISTPTASFADAEMRRLEHLRIRAANRVAIARNDHEDTKREFRLTDRVPLRAITDGASK